MTVGTGSHTYEVMPGWGQLPSGWQWGWIPAVAVDSQDRVFIYSRSDHPLVLFDREGRFLDSWGEEVLQDAHGLFIDAEDYVYCVERNPHVIRKFDPEGQLVMTLGTPDVPGADGQPFNLPTDLAVASDGSLYITDGYGNTRVHHFSPDGELLHSWGQPGAGPGEFNLPHSVWEDAEGRVWVADRENGRIQIFDADGGFLTQWTGLLQPNDLYFSPDGTIFVAELGFRVSILSPEGKVLARWGEEGSAPGQFRGGPHGIWTDSQGDLYVTEVRTDGQLHKFSRVP